MLKAIKNQRSVSSTLWLLRIGWFFFSTMELIVPVAVLLYTNKGITIGDFFLIQGIFRLAQFLFEIPSGYLSDRFSRRKVLILGALVHMFGFIILAFAHGFLEILIAESCFGVACALFSGTLEAYTYDLLKRNKTQKQFLKEYGSIMTYGQIAAFLSTLLGGVLYKIIGGTALILIIALFCLAQTIAYIAIPELLEVKRKKQKNKTALADAIGITYTTLKNSKLRNFILFPAFFGGFTIILTWISQPIMEQAAIPLALFGIFFGINKFSSIFFSKYAYKICDKLGEIKVSILSILFIILGFLSTFIILNTANIVMIYILCGFLAIVPSVRILNNLQYNTLIHNDISSQKRGTVLSTRAMVSTVFSATTLTCAKFFLDNYNIQTTMLFMLCMTIILFWSLKQVKKHIK